MIIKSTMFFICQVVMFKLKCMYTKLNEVPPMSASGILLFIVALVFWPYTFIVLCCAFCAALVILPCWGIFKLLENVASDLSKMV